jgi:glycerol-3-phosphate acyltransferase PlsY
MISYIVIVLVAYFIGSLPTAYLLLKRKSNLDIRKEGSGNVGSMNAYEVSGSKVVGIIVGVGDALKGVIAVLVASTIMPDSFWAVALGLLVSIVGHNYSVWLRFKGGRGLATAAGGLFVIGIGYTIFWCVIWAGVRITKKDILFSNIVATITAPIALLLCPATWIQKLMIASGSAVDYLELSLLLSALLLLSHANVMREAFVGAKKL